MNLFNRVKSAFRLFKQKPLPTNLPNAEQLIRAFGGANNIRHVNACMTRLRVKVSETQQVQIEALKQLGAKGVIEQHGEVQAVFGVDSEPLKEEMNQWLQLKTDTSDHAAAKSQKEESPLLFDSALEESCDAIFNGFGGLKNIESIQCCAHSRIRLSLKQPIELNLKALKIPYVEAIMLISPTLYHLISLQKSLGIADHLNQQHSAGGEASKQTNV